MTSTVRDTTSRRRSSLRWRLPLMVSTLIVGIAAVFLWAAYQTAERGLLQAGSDRAQSAADQIASLTQPGLRQRIVDERKVAESEDVVHFVQGGDEEGRSRALSQLAKLAVGAGPQVLTIWDRAGRVLLTSATPATAEATLGPVVKPDGRALMIDTVGTRTVYQELTEIAPRAPNEARAVVGYLTVRRTLSASASGSNTLNRLLGGGARVLLGSRSTSWSDLASVVPAPPVESKAGARGEWTVNGERRLGAMAEVTNTPWLVWVDVPRALVVAPAVEFLRRMGLIALISVALGIGIGYVAAGMITRPLQDLTAMAEAIARGDYSRRVEEVRHDEIGRLGRAFNDMMAQIQAAHEQRVVERTALLLEANRTLEAEMTARSRMEIDLRQAQKLESVGRLAAGVAHEINTPIQFVSDSLHFVRDAMRDIATVLGRYRGWSAHADPEGVDRAAIQRLEEDVDLAYSLDNVPKALERSLEGLDRVATIVRSMKEFAHPDQKDMMTVDLNQAIRSTLVVARTEYKYVADIDVDLGEIPRVTCYGGDVNQAVLNILVNAAHAIEETVQGTDRKGRIGVQTSQDGDWVVIRISDTGGGIPEAVRDRVFDPFFTTKEVGKGTGQGLAIARAVIVDKHKGEITFETEPGVGTTFVLRLPIAGKKAPGVAA
jgi:signal transduction histidine kinase